MELKVKTSHWSAGIPVALINQKTAEKIGVHPGDRITIKTLTDKPKEMATILDTAVHHIKEKELSISLEIKEMLGLRNGQRVEVSLSSTPESVGYIKDKLNGKKLSDKKIKIIIKDIVGNALSEPEIALFISAMYKIGMDTKETIGLIKAILSSGRTMSFRKKYVVDKHCIGGIAGNRTTPIVVSICAAAGLTFPKTSSRAITSAAGTADCIEVLSPIEFTMEKLNKIVEKVGACLTWGGSVGMVPADSLIIKVEKMLKIDPQAQLLASIMSKKLAAGSKYILIDIPYGKKAKVTKKKGLILKKKFEELAKHFDVKMMVLLTKATEPIGNGIGPALEIKDVMNVLNPKKEGPEDLKKKSIYLSGKILEMTGITKAGKGKYLASSILESGKAWGIFNDIIKAQKGKVKEITPSKISKILCASKSGKIKSIDNKLINLLAREAGCPLDKYAGAYLHHHVGDKVKKNEKLITIYAESKSRLNQAVKFYQKTCPIKINN